MLNYRYVRTLDFGDVVIRKTHTAGISQKIIDLSYNPEYPREYYADIRTDLRTNQPFAVLLDENLEEVYK